MDMEPISLESIQNQQYSPSGQVYGNGLSNDDFNQKNKKSDKGRLFIWATLAIILLLLLLAFFGYIITKSHSNRSQVKNDQSSIAPSLITIDQLNLGQLGQVDLNGILRINGGLIIQPSTQPGSALPGQIYFNDKDKQIYYYDGKDFQNLVTEGNSVRTFGGVTGDINLGQGFSLQGNTLSVQPSQSSTANSGSDGSGVATVQGQSGNIVFLAGSGIGISGTTISNTAVTSLNGSIGNIIPGRGLSASGMNLISTVSLTSGSASLLVTDDGNGNYTISQVGAGSSGSVALGPILTQTDASNFSSINIDKTGTGDLIHIQTNGVDSFVVTNDGTLSVGSVPFANITGLPSIVNSLTDGTTTSSGTITIGSGLSLVGNTLSSTSGGVTSLNTFSGAVSVQGTANRVSVSNSSNVVTLSTPQDIATSSSPTFSGLSLTSNLSVAGNGLISGNLSVSGTSSFNNNIIVQTGNSLTVNGDAFTDLTGTGLIISGGSLQTTLGTNIGSSEIIDGTIATADIATSAITSGLIADGTITSTDISAGSITNASLTNSAVTITAGTGLSGGGSVALGSSVTLTSTLGTDITSSEIVDATITAADVAGNVFVELGRTTAQTDASANSTIFINKTNATGNLIQLQNTASNVFVVSNAGILTTASVNSASIVDGTVALADLASDSVNSSKIVDGSITGTDIGSATVANSNLVNSSLTVTAGSGLINGGSVALGASTTLNIGAGNGITVNADDISVRVLTAADALAATTSSGSGMEVLASGLGLLQGCANNDILKWNETTDVWACASDAGLTSETDGIVGNEVLNATASGGLTRSGTGTGVDPYTLGITAGGVTNTMLANSSITVSAGTGLTGGGSVALGGTVTLTNAFGSAIDLNSAEVTGILPVANGGTGASTLSANGLVMGNGTSAVSSVNGTSGQILIANGSNVPTFTTVTGDVLISSTGGTTIQADSVALGTDTAGNYVAGNTAGTGIAVTGSAGEGWSPTISLDYASTLAGNPTLSASQSSFASTGLIFEGSTADTNELLLTATDPASDITITLPNVTGTVITTGNLTSITTVGTITAGVWNGTALTDANVSDTLTASILVGSGSTTNAVDLGTAEVSGTLGVANGGTGATTLTQYGILYGNGTSAIQATAAGTSGQCLVANTSLAPTWGSCNGTLQTSYNFDTDGSDTIIALTTADDSLIFRNPASAGTDSTYVLTIDQLATGAKGGIDVQSAGTGNLLRVRDTTATAADVLTIADTGVTTFKSQTDSTTAFQIQNSSGTSLFNVNSSIGQIRVGDGTSGRITFEPLNGGTNNLWNIDNNAGAFRIFREDYATSGTGANGSVKLSIADGGAASFTSGASYMAAFDNTSGGNLSIRISTSGTVKSEIGIAASASAWINGSAIDDLVIRTNTAGQDIIIGPGAGSACTTTCGTVYTGRGTQKANLTVTGTGTTCTLGAGTGATNCTSDSRLKTNVSNLSGSLAKINQLRAVNYNWIDPTKPGNKIGFIAQELQQLFPEFVTVVDPNDPNQYLGIDYAALVAPLVGAVQEQQVEITGIQSQISSINSNLNNIQAGNFANINVAGNLTTLNLSVTGTATIANLTVNNNARFNANITIAGHIITAGNTPASNVLGASGTSANGATVSVDGNDSSGTITISTASTGALNPGQLAKVSFVNAFGQTPNITLTAVGSDSATLEVYVEPSTGNFIIGTNTAPQNGKVYKYSYHVIQ